MGYLLLECLDQLIKGLQVSRLARSGAQLGAGHRIPAVVHGQFQALGQIEIAARGHHVFTRDHQLHAAIDAPEPCVG